MSREQVVIHDPLHELADGSIQNGPNMLQRLANRGVVMLPVEHDRAFGALDGYFRRGWGEGWIFNRGAGERGCPMVLGVLPNMEHVYWCARIKAKGQNLRGSMKLVTNSSGGRLSGTLSPHMKAPALQSLGPPDRQGGWTIGGHSKMRVAIEGLLMLDLYASARDCVVLWSAVTQTRDHHDLLGGIKTIPSAQPS